MVYRAGRPVMPQTVPDPHIVTVVLALLHHEPLDRRRLMQAVERRTSARLRLDEAAVRRLLRVLECGGAIRGRYVLPPRGPADKEYSLTAEGVLLLRASCLEWARYRDGIDELLADVATDRGAGLPAR